MSIFAAVFYLPLICISLNTKMEKIVGKSILKHHDPIAAVQMLK